MIWDDVGMAAPVFEAGQRVPDNWHYVVTGQDYAPVIKRLLDRGQEITVDIETTGLYFDKHRFRGVGLTDGVEAWYTPWEIFCANDDSELLFDLNRCVLIAHNSKFEMKWFGSRGYTIPDRMHDTMILSHIVAPQLPRKSLDYLAKNILGVQEWKQKKPQDCNNDELFPHCCGDVWYTHALFKYFEPKLGPRRPLYEMEQRLLAILASMEIYGMPINVEGIIAKSIELGKQAEDIRQEIYTMTGGDPWNTKSLPTVRYKLKELGIPIPPSLTKDTLKAIQHPLGAKLLELRGVEKLKRTYADGILTKQENGRVSCDFNQCGTETGRLSCSKPNLQNIPKSDFRNFFINPSPPETELIVADYSQLELRIFAHYAKEKAMIQAFRAGQDIHSVTAATMFGVVLENVTPKQRQIAKNINFGIIYGMGARKLAWSIEQATGEPCEVETARELLEQYYSTYPAVRELQKYSTWLVERRAMAANSRYGWVENFYHRRRYVETNSAYTALNTVIQGTAGDFVKMRMVALADLLRGTKSYMVAQVHDEIIFVHWKEENLISTIVETMEDRETFTVHLTVNYGTGESWREAK